VLSIHVLLSKRTRGLVGPAELRSMEALSRLGQHFRAGPIVDEPP